jgi:sedoheptulose-bisphosphatase
VWDPLDGSAIVDNNWAVGSIVGIWGRGTGILGATGRDQLTAMVANYGPRTTAYVALDDGVYEFTYKAQGVATAGTLGHFVFYGGHLCLLLASPSYF